MFHTTVKTLSSGHEQRNIDWSQARQNWDISYGITSDEETAEMNFRDVLDFFYARQGKAHGFRFKDWMDFELERQFINLTDGTTATFQVYKRYSSGGVNYDRLLKKLVAGTVRVWVDGVERAQGSGASQFQVNVNTGVITLGSTLVALAGAVIEVECEFDVPVRFDTDHLQLSAALWNAASVPSIQIVELLA